MTWVRNDRLPGKKPYQCWYSRWLTIRLKRMRWKFPTTVSLRFFFIVSFGTLISLKPCVKWNWITKVVMVVRTRPVFYSKVRAHMSRDMAKPTKWNMCPAKTQISLGIRPVWSESSLSARRKLGSIATHWAQQRRRWSNWADAQADLSLRWVHTHFVGFVMSVLIYSVCVLTNKFDPAVWPTLINIHTEISLFEVDNIYI